MKNNSDMRRGADRMMEDLSDTMRLQMDLATRLVDQYAETSGRFVSQFLSQLAGQKTGTCCDVPEPCWMPADLGEIHCELCPGRRGTLRIRVTNTDFQKRAFDVVAAGPDAGRVSISPGSFTLWPKERAVVTVTFDAAVDEKTHCAELEALIWVFGCRNHFLRWTIDVGRRDSGCCHEVEVHDQPDYEHHWYDHFYCMRECFGPKTRPGRPEG